MEKLNLEQGSSEWLTYRYAHRNASEAGTVMGVNPYQTPYELRVEKETHQSTFEGNIATDYGHRWEEAARLKVGELLGIEFDTGVYREGLYSASLDAYGMDGNESVKVEIKCPFQRERSKLWHQSQIDNATWDQIIPEHYLWQVVHQDMVVPTTRTYFFIFIPGRDEEPDDFSLTQCFPTDGQKAQLKECWDDFYNDPPRPDIVMQEDKHLIEQMAQLRYWKGQKAVADAEVKSLQSELKDHTPIGVDIKYPDGSTIKWSSRAGSVDTKKIAEEFNINLDDYRNAPSTIQTIKLGK